MGSSKSDTGIGFIDNAVNFGVNQVVNPAAKNVEQGSSRLLKSYARAISTGDFNNFGNTLLETAMAVQTGGASLAAGYKAGENNVDRATQTASDKASAENTAQVAADAQAAKDKKQTEINDVVNALVETRRRSPGRAATLLTSIGAGSSYGPLLTSKG